MGKYKKVIKNNIFKVSALTWNKEFEFPDQGRSEGTSNVALKALIIKFERDFINLFIFNCLTSSTVFRTCFFSPFSSFNDEKN